MECGKCRLYGEHLEILKNLLYGCKKLEGTQYSKRQSNIFKVLEVKWFAENGLPPELTKWCTTNCDRSGSKVIEKDERKLF